MVGWLVKKKWKNWRYSASMLVVVVAFGGDVRWSGGLMGALVLGGSIEIRVGMAVLVENTGYGSISSSGEELPLVGLVAALYPDGEMTLDARGEMRAWPGPSPLVDVLCVSGVDGEVLRVEKIGRARDVARQAELCGFPASAAGMLAGYRLVHTLRGE